MGLGIGVAWRFRSPIFQWLMAPANGMLSPHDGLLIYTGPTEILGVTFWLMMRTGIIFAVPTALVITFWETHRLFSRDDQKKIAGTIGSVLLCWLLGASFAYYVMIPAGMGFLLNFGEGYAVPVIRISEYLDIVASMIFWIGVIFELPLIMFLLAKLRIISYRRFQKFHKFMYPTAGIFGAFFSPGLDMVTALLIAGPIIVLYQVGLVLANLAEAGRGSLVLSWIKRLLIRFLRGFMVALSLPAVLGIDAPHWLAGRVLAVWDGHYSTGTPSRGSAWLDRSHKWWLRMVERVLYLRTEV